MQELSSLVMTDTSKHLELLAKEGMVFIVVVFTIEQVLQLSLL